MSEHVPHLLHFCCGVEVGATDVTALHPEVIPTTECCLVQFLERAIVGDEHVPFHDREGIVFRELGAHVLV